MITVYEILKNRLWISPRTADLSDDDCLGLIKDRRLTAIVNLWSKPDPRCFSLVEYVNEPLPDGKITKLLEIKAFILADRVANIIENDGRVLIHCRGGRNRSGLVAGLVLYKMLDITGAQAVAMIQTARPRSLANQHFRTYLEQLP